MMRDGEQKANQRNENIESGPQNWRDKHQMHERLDCLVRRNYCEVLILRPADGFRGAQNNGQFHTAVNTDETHIISIVALNK